VSPTSGNARLRALIYNRASADRTGRRISTAAQDAENRATCQRQGWEVVATITDDGRSASRYAKREREGYDLVLQAIEGKVYGRIDILVCTAADRAERTLDGHLELRRLCAANSVLLAYKGRVYDLRLGDDRFSAGLDALLSEREADEISRRNRESHQASVRRGTPRSIAPYGYMREYDPATGHMLSQVPDPVTAPIVREIVARIIAGDTLWEIAADLNRRGIPTPRAYRNQQVGRSGDTSGWLTPNLRRMLSKQSLIGMRTHDGVVVGEGTWPAIVDPADWAKVQQILADPSRVLHRGTAPQYLLSGIAECGVCGAWLRPFDRKRPAYRCEGKVQTDSKAHVSRAREPLERFVTRPLLRRLERVDLAVLYPPEHDDDTAAVRAELATVEARLAEYEESAIAGGISAAAFSRIEARLQGQIDALRARIPQPWAVPPAVAEVVGPTAAQVWARWGGEPGGLLKQRQVVRALIRVQVYPVKQRGARTFEADTVLLTWRSGGP
jgi:site-specific DNA recombinase